MANFIPKISYGTGPTVYTFPHPPANFPFVSEQPKSNVKQTKAQDGSLQTVLYFTEVTFSPKFEFLTETDFQALMTMLTTWGAAGNPIDYYESSDLSAHVTYKLLAPALPNKRALWSPSKSSWMYEVTLPFWRVLDAAGILPGSPLPIPGITGSWASPILITAAGGISPAGLTNETIYVACGSDVTVSANPQIGAGTADGQELTLIYASSSFSLTLADGTGLISDGSIKMVQGTITVWRWNGSKWILKGWNNV